MFFSAAKNIFNIDNVGNRWGVRILYFVTVILNAAIHFNPYADKDFTPLSNWLMNLYNMSEMENASAILTAPPVSNGNIIYLLTLLGGELILIGSAYIYAAVYVRLYRKEKASMAEKDESGAINYAVNSIPDDIIKPGKLVLRILLLMLVTAIVLLPLVTIALYFMFFTIVGLPFIFTAPVAYLSGDKGIFTSIPYVAKLSLRYYFANMRSIALVLIVALILNFLVPLLENVSSTAYYIVDAAATAWIFLAAARLAALSYCSMKDFPIKGRRRPYAI
ncbi:MAG: hypothetical protein IKZ29_11295 [Clostridiales bacterium]|nr:hypothetical protein [Clostridiales bacterium]